ncbi:MAG: hypothetical protein ACI808_000568 [Paraglaciecola sp.]|jgi:hypothetical protein
MHKLFISFIVASTLGLSACATRIMEPFSESISYDELYLRGVFTWWEADPKYKLLKVANDRYATSIKLIADGQPYDFKFADADWTPGLNCGYLNEERDRVLSLGQPVKSSCETSDENFRFTPTETGVYEFTIDFSEPSLPIASVKRAD